MQDLEFRAGPEFTTALGLGLWVCAGLRVCIKGRCLAWVSEVFMIVWLRIGAYSVVWASRVGVQELGLFNSLDCGDACLACISCRGESLLGCGRHGNVSWILCNSRLGYRA